MFLRCKVRKKNGKEHRSLSIVENRRVAGGRVVQWHVLYLGRLNAELQKLEAELWRAGQALSAKRRKVIPQLSKAASKQLADLAACRT